MWEVQSTQQTPEDNQDFSGMLWLLAKCTYLMSSFSDLRVSLLRSSWDCVSRFVTFLAMSLYVQASPNPIRFWKREALVSMLSLSIICRQNCEMNSGSWKASFIVAVDKRRIPVAVLHCKQMCEKAFRTENSLLEIEACHWDIAMSKLMTVQCLKWVAIHRRSTYALQSPLISPRVWVINIDCSQRPLCLLHRSGVWAQEQQCACWCWRSHSQKIIKIWAWCKEVGRDYEYLSCTEDECKDIAWEPCSLTSATAIKTNLPFVNPVFREDLKSPSWCTDWCQNLGAAISSQALQKKHPGGTQCLAWNKLEECHPALFCGQGWRRPSGLQMRIRIHGRVPTHVSCADKCIS